METREANVSGSAGQARPNEEKTQTKQKQPLDEY